METLRLGLSFPAARRRNRQEGRAQTRALAVIERDPDAPERTDWLDIKGRSLCRLPVQDLPARSRSGEGRPESP